MCITDFGVRRGEYCVCQSLRNLEMGVGAVNEIQWDIFHQELVYTLYAELSCKESIYNVCILNFGLRSIGIDWLGFYLIFFIIFFRYF